MPLLAKADKCPPFLARMCARKNNGQKPMSVMDIAEASGIPRSTVAAMSKLKTWKTISVDAADRFSKACGVDLTNPSQAIKWLRRSGWAHVKNANANQRRFFSRLMSAKA